LNCVVEIDPAIDERWDVFVKNHPFGWICHHSGWKRVLEQSFGHMRGHYLATVDGAGQIKAGLPIFEVRSWLTGKRLVSIPFATLSDPLIGGNGDSKGLFDSAIDLSERVGIPRIEIRSHHSHELIDDERFTQSCVFKHHSLDLNLDLEQIRRSFNYKSVRYEINRSQKSGLILQVAQNENELRLFHKLHTETRGRLGLPPQTYRFFRALWQVLGPLDAITLLLAMREGELVAGQLFLKYNGRVSMEFEAWDCNKRHLAPNHFLIWEAIVYFRSLGYTSLDFGRTSLNNVSLMDFKRRWGTHVADLPQFYYPLNSRAVTTDREDSLAYKTIRQVCKRSRGLGLDLVGRLCYRHLG
jgi:hypothetical protein